MIITISGNPGSGKSTIGKMLSEKLKYSYLCVGDYMREMAENRGMSLKELGEIAKVDKSIDKELDDWQISLAKDFKNAVVVGRTSFHFLPKSFKLFLYVNSKEGARRIFNDKRPSERENTTLLETEKNSVAREKLEDLRYKKYYNLDIFDKSHYDLWLDTSDLTIPQVMDAILQKIDSRR